MRRLAAPSLAVLCSPRWPPSFSCQSYSAFSTARFRCPKQTNLTSPHQHTMFCRHRLMPEDLSMNSDELKHTEVSEPGHNRNHAGPPRSPAGEPRPREGQYPANDLSDGSP